MGTEIEVLPAADREDPLPGGAFRMTSEVDEFAGDNAGLVVAEIELEAEGVSDDPRYLNSSLVAKPYSTW